jgi:hypothetical protein
MKPDQQLDREVFLKIVTAVQDKLIAALKKDIRTRAMPASAAMQVGEILNKVPNGKTEFRERGKVKKASRIELSIRRLAASAVKGDIGSAASLLKMRAHAEKYRDAGPMIIRVFGGPPNAFP